MEDLVLNWDWNKKGKKESQKESQKGSGKKPNYRFYHIPKSGGTSIFRLTQPWRNFKRAHKRKNHVCISYYPPKWDEIPLAIVRHPYTRFESAFYHLVDSCDDRFYYRYAKNSDCNTLQKMGLDNFGTIFKKDPNLFLKSLVTKIDSNHHYANKIFERFDIFKPQYYWLSDIFGVKVYPKLKLIKYENMHEEINKIAEELGESSKGLETVNRRITNTNIPLTEESKRILNQLYKKDFEHFYQ